MYRRSNELFAGRRRRVISSGRTGRTLRRASVDVYGRRSNKRSYNDQCLSDDESDNMSVYHDRLHHPQNLLLWRHRWQPTDTRHYSCAAAADQNNDNSKYTSLPLILYVAICGM